MTFLLIFFGALLTLLLVASAPDLQSKIQSQQQDRAVALAVDWEDIMFFSGPSAEEKLYLLERLHKIPYSVVIASLDLKEQEENVLRETGFSLLWRFDEKSDWNCLLDRFQKGDGLLIGDVRISGFLNSSEFARLILNNQGFGPRLEFAPISLSDQYYRLIKSRTVKAHLLDSREMTTSKMDLWEARLLRAVNERWIRLLLLRFSPALSAEENLGFYEGVAKNLTDMDYRLGSVSLFPSWSAARWLGANTRLGLILLVAVLAPFFSFVLVQRLDGIPVVLVFLAASSLTIVSAITIHALGSHPDIVLGLTPMRGVKLQLVLPLVLAFVFCFYSDEWKSFLEMKIKGEHLIWIGGGLAFAMLFYLSRSGNYPLLSVTDKERRLRDLLEAFFGARPRFKEFLLGHPLFILGLYLQRLMKTQKASLEYRPFVLFGLLGQISIVNTFGHFQAPFYLGVLRTFHGLWIGMLLSLPLCHFYPKVAAKIHMLRYRHE